jgi:microcin C transport system permease protein
MNPLNRRRLAAFRASKRGMISLVVFGLLFFFSLFAEFLANNRPILVYYDGAFYMPLFRDYPETTFGGEFPTNAVYTDAYLQKSIEEKAGSSGRPFPTATTRCWAARVARPFSRRLGSTRSAPTTRRVTCSPA